MIESVSQLGLSFFGLTSDLAPQVRVDIFTQIHEIVFHGKGGFTYDTVYDMPVWLRNFTFKRIQEFYDKQNESVNKHSNHSPTPGKSTSFTPVDMVNPNKKLFQQ